MNIIIRIIELLWIMRTIPHILVFKMAPAKLVIEKDMERWFEATQHPEKSRLPKWRGLVWLLWRLPEFRNLFYYRLAGKKSIIATILLQLARFLCKPMDALRIHAREVGAGFFIQHGFSTTLSAESIGENFWVNQQVTIGYSDANARPTIGNNVRVTAGAKVFGGITIGDNVIIGANAVVFKDVPPNCTVVGVPAYIVKRDGVKVKEPL